jgi:signal transduction histidine kinase
MITTRDRTRTRARSAAGLIAAAGCAGLVVACGLVDLATPSGARDVTGTDPGVLGALIGLLVTGAGAVILGHDRPNRIGVVLVAFGTLWAVDGFAESWVAYSVASGAPGATAAFWFYERVGAFLLLGLPLVLTLYPDGRFMPGGWGVTGRVGIGLAALLPVALVLAPTSAVYEGDVPPWIDPAVPALPLPDGAWVVLLTVARTLTFAGLLLPIAVVFARHHRATGLDRTRLRWLLWAALICVLVVVVGLLVPGSTMAYLALVTAVAVTAASVTIGIVRPDLIDIDALVAGTLVSAAVGAIVIALDLAIIAAGNELLGDQLDERSVTVVVLIVAVVLYGPLRHWLGRWVRRLLVGRRADRYTVVSTLARRLESSGRVDEQLPALAAAVAEAFKVPYVGVEIVQSGGGSLMAEHGTAPADRSAVAELPITYQNERIGRLLLPAHGFRALMSRRDQALLLDVVRQAAIAVRSATLARELQLARERLVLAREEDRRRIRRDLHDGLGPALGGVALRLDAAGNAIDTDPDRTRQLVRQSRQDVTDALSDVRRLVHGLRPPALDDFGLVAALEHQVEAASAALEVDLVAGELGALPAAVEVAAYRIVSEALTNVVRHAAATTCRVSLTVDAGGLRIEVADDGRGIDTGAVAGVGLRSLRERAEELGGRCDVRCPAAGGTVVRARIPITEEPA